MGIFTGKTPTERNKIIAAIVLGTLALISLIYTFGGLLWGGRGTTTVTVNASPSPTLSPGNRPGNQPDPNFPTREQLYSEYTKVPINYNPQSFFAPQPGRNIFAFYEPGAPTPVPSFSPVEKSPTPFPTPTPTPIPPQFLSSVNPQFTYAGLKTFRLDVGGDKFTPETLIYFNAIPLQTTYISPQRLSAQIPAEYIANSGDIRIFAATPDGKLYSNERTFEIKEPPRPEFTYIGLIARRHNNNDTAYFQEKNKNEPTEARLNDVVGGRFRVISISVEEVELQDTQLGFRYRVKLERPDSRSGSFTSQPTPRPRPGRRSNRQEDDDNDVDDSIDEDGNR